MPHQPQQPDRRPYNRLLSSLRKPDLIRLCTKFNLPSDGSVLDLRDRAKHHLTQNSEVLYRNPRFRPLYPNVHRINQRPQAPSSTLSTKSPTRLPSPTPSFNSWHGIDEPDHQQDVIHSDNPYQLLPQPQHLPDHPPPPVGHHRSTPEDLNNLYF